MPELPEVETVVRDLRAHRLVGRRIDRVQVHWARTVSQPSLVEFRRRLPGQSIEGIRRRGKYLVFALSGPGSLLVHLRMTGQFSVNSSHEPRDKHTRVVLRLDDGRELRFRDPRKFGRWALVPDAAGFLAKLGPEPLDDSFTADVFEQRIRGRRGMLKPLLLNQAFLAGLGNIYVDETLWLAGLHPQRRAETLDARERQTLHRAIRAVLQQGVDGFGTTLGRTSMNFHSASGRRGRNQNFLKVFRRTGEACPRCGAVIERIMVGQRSSHVCRVCQPVPRARAGCAGRRRGARSHPPAVGPAPAAGRRVRG